MVLIVSDSDAYRDLPALSGQSCKLLPAMEPHESSKRLEELKFDNLTLRNLPVDSSWKTYPRQVSGACYARVNPTPLLNPRLVAASDEALRLLDLSPDEAERPDFGEVFGGNRLLEGMEGAAHCYCGYQFGMFSGQLGDGAVIYLGEVVNRRGERWELQVKGGARPPSPRAADGRKVLRSSIREFLASEALFHLGIPTTRAGAVITSDTRVVRDPLYRGEPVQERCSVVLRIAPSFLRFGSFEIFHKRDSLTGAFEGFLAEGVKFIGRGHAYFNYWEGEGKQGPSWDSEGSLADDMIPRMLDHITSTYFPDIWKKNFGDHIKETDLKKGAYMDMMREVVRRTAALVASWQSVGFVHGVLNTDNMSMLGLTLDYGPFGFLDRYDPGHVPNSSDEMRRYEYSAQPGICRWNCAKLVEVLKRYLPMRAAAELDNLYLRHYDECYWRLMKRKLGLLQVSDNKADQSLISDLLQVMHETGADFTNTFRVLSRVPMPDPSDEGAERAGLEDGGVLEAILESGLPDLATLIKATDSRIPEQARQLLLLMKDKDPNLLAVLGLTKETVVKEAARAERAAELRRMDPADKPVRDRDRWTGWLRRYIRRLRMESVAGANPLTRVAVMNSVNPKYVLRNWIAQQAIEKAKEGDYSEVRRVLYLLRHPFDDDAADRLAASEEGDPVTGHCQVPLRYDGPVPAWAEDLCVSCSS